MWKDADPDIPILEASESRVREATVARAGVRSFGSLLFVRNMGWKR
jgi:hypothetical protein